MKYSAQKHPASTIKKLYPIASVLATNTHFRLMLNLTAQSRLAPCAVPGAGFSIQLAAGDGGFEPDNETSGRNHGVMQVDPNTSDTFWPFT